MARNRVIRNDMTEQGSNAHSTVHAANEMTAPVANGTTVRNVRN